MSGAVADVETIGLDARRDDRTSTPGMSRLFTSTSRVIRSPFTERCIGADWFL